MHKKQRRTRTVAALVITAMVAVLTTVPVTGEEIKEEWDMEGIDDVTLNTVHTEEIVPDFLRDTGTDSETEELYHGYNRSESANTYCGAIFVSGDGLYDAPKHGKKISVPGISCDPYKHIISLNNVNIGSVYDDTLSRDKGGALVFMGYEIDDENNSEASSEGDYIKYTIDMKGHNYLGGYSTFERRDNFWNSWNIWYKNGLDDVYYNISSPLALDLASAANHPVVVSFEGDGDITINGPVQMPFITDKTIWYSYDSEGTGIVSDNMADMKNRAAKSGQQWSDLDGVRNHLGRGWGCGVIEVAKPFGMDSCDCQGLRYFRVGGDRPQVPESTGTECYGYTTVSLRQIGGHEVRIEFTDNIPYDGRKILPERTLNGFNDSVKKYGYTVGGGDDEFPDQYYLDSIEYKSSSRCEFGVDVYIDDDHWFNNYDPYLAKHYNDESKRLHSVVVKLKNNTDVPDMNSPDPKIPEFTLSLKKECGLDEAFIKEFNDYFKKKGNAISFNIVPCDIKYTETTFLGKKGCIKDKDSYDKADYKRIREGLLKKNLKTSGSTLKKIALAGPRLCIDTKRDSQIDSTTKMLKWDKKYTPSHPDKNMDFHAEISGNYIILTGQGNYSGTITVNNPLLKEDEYFLGSGGGLRRYIGTIYNYEK